MLINGLDFDYLRQLVYQHTSIMLDSDKAYLAELRLAPLATQKGFHSIKEFIRHLQVQPFNGLHIQTVEAMLLTETSFFRDSHPFDALSTFVLPDLVSKRKTEQRLNIWCAACSSGQEPYSIALLLHEQFPHLSHWTLNLLATDLSSEMLSRASRGCYSQLEVMRGLPTELLLKYFKPLQQEWQLQEEIRTMVTFSQMNLVQTSIAEPIFDIIFLRNVLIYFDVDVKKKVLAKVRQVLAPDGYLFLGGGETTLNLDRSFKRVQFDKAICYQLNS